MRTKRMKTKKNLLTKAVSLLLSLCVITGVLQSFTLTTYSASAPEVTLYSDGKIAENVFFSQYEKKEIKAVCGTNGVTYNWQVLTDTNEEQWTDIQGAGSDTLSLSYPLLLPVLDGVSSAYVRCAVSDGLTIGCSAPLCVTVSLEAETAAAPKTDNISVKKIVKAARRAAAAAQSDENIITVTVNYLDAVSSLPIYTGFTARIDRGREYKNTVVSPTYLGYKPWYNPDNLAETNPAECKVHGASVYVDVPADYANSTYTVNVYYKADTVSYAIKYFFQNINDDFYTENSALYRRGAAETGTIVDDADIDLGEDEAYGFTKLYHYPQAVAADGSTVFESYYDRNYSMLKFDNAGGYGTDPVYARYGTPFLVNNPTRHGYVFDGWALLDDNGEIVQKHATLPATVPAESRNYRALWKTVNTQYTVAYWLQNADDDDYSYIGAVEKYENSGETVYPKDDLTATTPICADDTHIKSTDHTEDCYPKNFKHYVYDGEKTNEANRELVIKGDGSSVLNIYYTRKYYTLRFFYAKEYKGSEDRNPNRDPNNTFTGTRYSVVGNSTYGFGNVPKNSAWFSKNQDYSLDDLFSQLTAYTSGDKWGTIDGDLPKITDPDIAGAHYKTGVYPAEGEGYKDSTSSGNYDKYGDRYHYFELTARYGADLTKLWPVDVFGKLRIYKPETHNLNGGSSALTDINGTEGEGWGNYAYPSGWNGEYKVQYSISNENATVKGLYQKLDDTVLLGKWNTTQYEYEDSGKMTRKIETETTVGGKRVSSNVCYFLNFFDNGANVRWSVPRRWIYESYVPVFQSELKEFSAAEVRQITEAKAPTELNGQTYYYRNGSIYRLYNTVTTNDDNIIKSDGSVSGQTQTALEGFKQEADSTRYELIDNGTLTDRRRSFTARFFYTRDTFSLVMHSHGETYFAESGVEFNSALDGYVYNSDGTVREPEYPATLEKGAYTFAGWYTSPECLDGTEYVKGAKMPASNLALYAKWAPCTYTVNFFKNYDDMLKYESGDSSVKPLESRTVEHGAVTGSVNNPADDFSGYNYTFGGWFYMRLGKKTAYTPLDIPVTRNLNVFADWGSQSAQPYRIHYAVLETEKDKAWLELLYADEGAQYQTDFSYKLKLGDEERSYVYLEARDGEPAGFHREIADSSRGYAYLGNTRTFYPKTGNPFYQLYDEYNNGYYPTLASHSVTIKYEDNKNEPEENVFTFTYVSLKEISYTVEYRYLENGEPVPNVPEEGKNGSVLKTTTLAVVTERFAVVKDYIPDAFYKRLILAVERNEDGEYVGSKDNVITFYYTKNTANAYYAVHYMLQKLGAEGDDITAKDGDNYKYYTESTSHTEGIGAVGSEIFVKPLEFTGFGVYNKNGSGAGLIDSGNGPSDIKMSGEAFNITISESGTELYIFYTRKQQNYKAFYLLDGTNTDNPDNLVFDKNDHDRKNGVLQEGITGAAAYGATVTETAPNIPGMTCISLKTQSIVLSQNEKQNIIIFFYTPLSYSVQYKAWEYGGGTFDVTQEVISDAGSFKGSVPAAAEGYEFVGWYLDPAGTVEADSELVDASTNRLTPSRDKLKPEPETNIFYARFIPAFSSLTIKRQNAKDEGNGSQVFVYKITAVTDSELTVYITLTADENGSGSVTVRDLPCRDYTVEQVGSWSWRYKDSSQTVSVKKGVDNTVTFSKAAAEQYRLNGNSAPVQNRRQGVTLS